MPEVSLQLHFLRVRACAQVHELTIPKNCDVPTTPVFTRAFSTPMDIASGNEKSTQSIGKATRRLQVRRSGVHGRGVFAMRNLAAGERLIEYAGEIIDWPEALLRHPHDPAQPNHTFYFHIEGGNVIDGKHGGNSSRWINHSCQPNCEAEEINSRVFIKTLHAIAAGEELFFDYALILEGRHTPQVKAEYACWCGALLCRKTMLAPKTRATRSKTAAIAPVVSSESSP